MIGGGKRTVSAAAVIVLLGLLPVLPPLAAAAPAASDRAPTRIPAESLGPALRTLAKERRFQVVYVSSEVDHQRTRGASGNLTTDEALRQVLRDTGLTYYRMSEEGIVVEPIATGRTPKPPQPRVAAASPPPTTNRGAPPAAHASLGSVTIEAREDRRTLRRKVDHFISSVIVQPSGDALDRWNVQVCPLVAGLPREFGELILASISQAAIDAHVPLAGKVCHPNLLVVAHDDVAQLVRKWWRHDLRGFEFENRGIETVERFFRSKRPIRAWYNTQWGGADGRDCASAMSAAQIGAGLPGPIDAQPCTNGVDTRLTYSSTASNITSAIIVVDLSRMKDMTTRQLADYIALIGLADVRLDADPSSAPSILGLFDQARPPQAMTQWDRALLYSLYNTSQADKMQLSEMELTMVRRIAP
jgi:Secretin and TonB N terminus short domain